MQLISAIHKVAAFGSALVLCAALMACSPEVGSDAWCEDMKEKSKADWSANDAANFAKHCVFK